MSESSREEKLQAWLEAERAMWARLKPGTLSMSEVVQLSPREFFDGIGRGDLPSPPIGELMGFVPIEWSEERFVFQGVPDARHYNPLGTVHGGYAATLLDSCMGCAIHMHVKPGLVSYTHRRGRPGCRGAGAGCTRAGGCRPRGRSPGRAPRG